MPISESKYHQSKEELKREEKLIKAAKRDPRAFSPLYDKYYLPVFRFVFQRVADEDTAADVTSQVFAKALMKIKKFKFTGVPFSAWLFRVASNEMNMMFRKQKVKRVVNVKTEQLHQIADEIKDTNQEEREQKVLAALKKLDEEETNYIELRYFENRSYREMGEILGIEEGNARVKTHRIIQKLKKMILPKRKKS